MTRITTYEGNSIIVIRDYDDLTTTTLSAFTVKFTAKRNKDDTAALIEKTGVVSGSGVVFTIDPTDNVLDKGISYFEVTAETATQKVTLEQDRIYVKESIVYVS